MTNDKIIKDFGTMMRTRRIQLGKTQDDVALHMGWSRPLVIKIEQGNRKSLPSREQIEMIAKFLDMDVDSLMGSNTIIIDRFDSEEQELLKDEESTVYIKVALAKMRKDRMDAEAASNLKLRQDIYAGRA